jgi:hypothetical protein
LVDLEIRLGLKPICIDLSKNQKLNKSQADRSNLTAPSTNILIASIFVKIIFCFLFFYALQFEREKKRIF